MYRCNDCSYDGKRVIIVEKSIMCPVCSGNMRIFTKRITEELERQDVETTSCDVIESKKSDLETIVDEWYV